MSQSEGGPLNSRPDLPEMPARIKALPVDEHGYPVPWFVGWVDGKPDYALIEFDKFVRAADEKRCWVCGEFLGAHRAFVTEAMAAFTRLTTEPPCHSECAIFSVTACPFLTKRWVRAGEENLEVAWVWITKSYKWETDVDLIRDMHDVRFRIGTCRKVLFYTAGRKATLEEVRRSMDAALRVLYEHNGREESLENFATRMKLKLSGVPIPDA